jgi:transcriptional regulator with PAS, ATPase and Fis domain
MVRSEYSENLSAQTTPVINNHLEALKVLSNSILREIQAIHIDEQIDPAREIDLAAEVQRFEEELIRSALIRAGGRQRRAAKLLNVKVTTLNAKVKRYRIL